MKLYFLLFKSKILIHFFILLFDLHFTLLGLALRKHELLYILKIADTKYQAQQYQQKEKNIQKQQLAGNLFKILYITYSSSGFYPPRRKQVRVSATAYY